MRKCCKEPDKKKSKYQTLEWAIMAIVQIEKEIYYNLIGKFLLNIIKICCEAKQVLIFNK